MEDNNNMATKIKPASAATPTGKPQEYKLTIGALPEGFIHEKDALARESREIQIDSDSECAYWQSRSIAGNALIKNIKDYYEEVRASAHKTWKMIVALIDGPTSAIERDVRAIDRAILNYRRRKLERAEQERQILQEAANKQHDDLVLAEAEQLQRHGDASGAELVLQAGAAAQPVVAITDAAPPAVKGYAFTQGWDFEIVDASGQVVEDSPLLPREYLMPNEKAIRRVVGALGDKARIPGVRIKRTEGTRKSRS